MSLQGDARVCRSSKIQLAGKTIELIAVNTAILSQRDEQVGTLAVPMTLLNDLPVKESEIDATICVYHHPDNWLDPNFRRDFRKFVESRAHIVFTGHEHLQDSHWTEASTGRAHSLHRGRCITSKGLRPQERIQLPAD